MEPPVPSDTHAVMATHRQMQRAQLAAVHADLITDLKMPQPWRCALQIATQWLVMIAAIGIAIAAHSLPVTLIALVVIATRQHGLLVLMHDASHYLLSRHKTRNDLIAGWLLTFPLTISTSRYRTHHLAHHRHLNSAADPDYADAFAPDSRRRLYWLLLRDLSGFSTLQSLRSMDSFGVFGLFQQRRSENRLERQSFIAFAVALIVAASAWHLWFDLLLFWLAPMVFFLPPILRIRSLSEHAGRAQEPVGQDARSVSPNLIEKLLFAPCNINRHWEHHLFPQVPSYRLHTLSMRLSERLPDSAAKHTTRGYLSGAASMLSELYSSPCDASPVAHNE